MNPHRYHLKINLKLEAVTCPGVWLCSHGYVEVTVKVLGYFFRTGPMEPYFPLLCHDEFKMEGYFKNAKSMVSLMDNLSKEQLEITLWQNSRRMAYYEGVLMDLLQYNEPKLQCPHTNTRQLLMKTTPAFPGVIAPQVELTSNLLIKDKVLNLYNTCDDMRKCVNTFKKPQDIFKNKLSQYQRPCIAQNLKSGFLNADSRLRKQRTVCHTKEHIIKKPTDESVYTKSCGRRVSIASRSSSDSTHTSVGICDIEHDSHERSFDEHNHEICQLCRLYKDVFQI